MKMNQHKAPIIDDFEQLVIKELESRHLLTLGLKLNRAIPTVELSPLRQSSYQQVSEQNHQKKSPLLKTKKSHACLQEKRTPFAELSTNKQSAVSKHPVFQSSDYYELKHLEKEAKKVHPFDSGILQSVTKEGRKDGSQNSYTGQD